MGAQLAAEVGLQPGGAAEVHLEALDLVAVGVEHQLALEADVGDLGAGAGVRAAVDVDGDRRVEVGEPPLELGDEVAGAVLGVDDRELAELDAGAGHRVAAASCDGRAERPIASRPVDAASSTPVGVDADQHDLLVRREPGAGDAVLLDQVGELRPAAVPETRPTVGAMPT